MSTDAFTAMREALPAGFIEWLRSQADEASMDVGAFTQEGGGLPPAHMVAHMRMLHNAADVLTAAPSLAANEDLHPATANLIDRFAAALKEKAANAERKYGYSDGWASPDWREELQAKMAEHVQKGDPRDVAIYAAFAWHHGWPTADAARLGGAS